MAPATAPMEASSGREAGGAARLRSRGARWGWARETSSGPSARCGTPPSSMPTKWRARPLQWKVGWMRRSRDGPTTWRRIGPRLGSELGSDLIGRFASSQRWAVSDLRNWSRRGDSNSRPAVYETAALPLSYVGLGSPARSSRHLSGLRFARHRSCDRSHLGRSRPDRRRRLDGTSGGDDRHHMRVPAPGGRMPPWPAPAPRLALLEPPGQGAARRWSGQVVESVVAPANHRPRGPRGRRPDPEGSGLPDRRPLSRPAP